VTHIVAVDKETQKTVGSIAYALRQTYTEQPMAEMDKFYVLPEWRNSAIGHILLTMAMEIAKDEGAAVFRAGLSSGISSGQNLFRRHGFLETPHSILFVKEL
jgi:ribosomal protein S18 acetylase RimI-like enzyme